MYAPITEVMLKGWARKQIGIETASIKTAPTVSTYVTGLGGFKNQIYGFGLDTNQNRTYKTETKPQNEN